MVVEHIQASKLQSGVHFNLFQRLCTTVFVERNEFGMTVLRFIISGDNSPELSVLIVPNDLIFETHL